MFAIFNLVVCDQVEANSEGVCILFECHCRFQGNGGRGGVANAWACLGAETAPAFGPNDRIIGAYVNDGTSPRTT